MIKKLITGFIVLVLSFFFFAQNNSSATAYKTYETSNASAPVVYFTRDISALGLLKVYNALNQQIRGKVGIKVSFGSPDEPYINPKLLTELVKKTNGTFLDANGLSGNRWTSAMNLALAKAHGFTDIAKCVMLDDDKKIDMPVRDGYFLKFARTGKELDDYDTMISVHRFKMHYIEALGGNIKNISLCMGNRSGKCLIHSAGEDANRYHNTPADVLPRTFVDAASAVLDYKKNWAFINVLDAMKPQDSCDGTTARSDIGIFASTDVVALDQCCTDYELSLASSAAQREQWARFHQVNVMEYAEAHSLGRRNYRLVEIN